MNMRETLREDRDDWDEEVDVLVLGAGAGGMAAALVAAIEGMTVKLCEATDQVGGTAATSAGTVWIPGNAQSRAAGFEDSIADARTYFGRLLDDPAGDAMRDIYLRSGPGVIDWFAARSDVVFVPCGTHPDYRKEPGAAVSGRALVPRLFDARVLGRAFRDVRPPIPEFMVFGGMMVGKDDIPKLVGRFESVAAFRHAAGLFLRFVSDRLRGFPRGTRLTMGNALVGRLYHSLRTHRVETTFNAALVEPIARDGQVLGAVVDVAGRRLRVRARAGTILATGGFARNEGLRRRFFPQPTPVHSMAVASNRGDGVEAGLRVGGHAQPERHGSGGFWSPVSVTTRADGSRGLFPHLSLDRAKPGLLAVNQTGRRFVNEADSYHDFVLAMFATHGRDAAIPAWLVCSTAFVARYGLGAIHPGTTDLGRFVRQGDLVTAPDLPTLAARMGVDAATLQATVDRHDAMARTGVDADFHKGESALNRFNGDPAHGPNPCIGVLGDGPYCALAVHPAEIACSTGLATDADARVLAADGRAIDGLYACGNDMASVMNGSYPGPGTTLGPALVFGWRAAQHAKARAAATQPAATESIA